eukprot:Blabericola_migrator_1__7455@NODE_3802_length_1499_cov_7_787709_g2357_i0_p1_GENE_NODE_3802_length_1499_cov_7_787709_g2357_i0NODE_3802_length_1499_cov_7_787709_g2357_i0_p1_ORF_typecomplete_len443_score63_81EFhand_8/PF13833_6/0_59_NODE_3802_length_1499_cov_7_787709_g2357_i0931421
MVKGVVKKGQLTSYLRCFFMSLGEARNSYCLLQVFQMSGRFLQSPDLTNCDGHRALTAALLVALAVNPSLQTVSALDDVDHAEVSVNPPREHKWSSNSVDLLYAGEEAQEEPAFVPLFLRPIDSRIIVDRDALQKVFNAVNEGLSDTEIQELINRCFPANDFSQHLFSHLRVFLAGKPFLNVAPPRDRSWLMRKLRAAPSESVESIDAESIVALRQIESAQRWFAVHFRTVAHIMNTSLLLDYQLMQCKSDGTLIPKPGTDFTNPVYSALTLHEIQEVHGMSDHFKKVALQLVLKTRALKAKLDSESRKEWSKYAKRLGFERGDGLIFLLQVKRRLHSIQWMLKYGPPKFFANHRNEFAELADLLTQYKGATDGPSTQLLKNLRFLGRAMREMSLTAEDLEPFEEHCKALAAHKHWMAPNRPFMFSNPQQSYSVQKGEQSAN